MYSFVKSVLCMQRKDEKDPRERLMCEVGRMMLRR